MPTTVGLRHTPLADEIRSTLAVDTCAPMVQHLLMVAFKQAYQQIHSYLRSRGSTLADGGV